MDAPIVYTFSAPRDLTPFLATLAKRQIGDAQQTKKFSDDFQNNAVVGNTYPYGFFVV